MKPSRLTAAVSREQLRQGSALSNRHFDSTTAEVCASIKLRAGHGLILGSPPWSLTLAKGNGSSPPQTLEPLCFGVHQDTEAALGAPT